MADPIAMPSALAPGVALTSAVIYWANLQNRLGTISTRLRALNAELRSTHQGSPRAASIGRQVAILTRRMRVLHKGVVLSVVTLMAFLGASAIVFVVPRSSGLRDDTAATLFMLGLLTFGGSLATMLWEMLWSGRSLEEDVAGSQPLPPRS